MKCVVLMEEIVEVAKRFRLEMDFVIGEIIKNSVNLIVIKSAKEHIGQQYQQSREIANPDVIDS